MTNFLALLLLLSLALLIIGLIKPSVSLFWDKAEPTRKKSSIVYGGLIILFFILFGATTDTKNTSLKTDKNASQNKIKVVQQLESDPQKLIKEQAVKDSIEKVKKENEIAEIAKNTITAKDLTASYEANEVAADNKFKGKVFYVSGIITDIKKDFSDDIYVILQGDEMFRSVQCYFEDKEMAGKMEKGMKVTFKGKCDGLMMNVLMKDCTLEM